MAKQQIQSNRAPTRKQIAFSRRERQQLRMIYIGLGIVGALILTVLAFGLLQTFVFEPNAPVASVNGVEIITRDYQNRVRYERFVLEDEYAQISQQLAALQQPGNEQLAQFLQGQYEQRANQILQQRALVDRQTVDVMIEDKLVEAEAQKRGITVTPEEITEYIHRFLASQSGGLTAAAATEMATARAEASATAALWTPTPTFTPSPTITPTAEITQPTGTPTNTSTPTPTPTPNIIDEATLSTRYTEWLQTLADRAEIGQAEYEQFVRTFILREKLQEALGEEVPTSAEHAHARHIFVETEEEAKDVIERLEKGEDFADVAAELSTDEEGAAQDSDLGFVPRGTVIGPVDEALFTLPIGQVSEPIKSDIGWHIIEVLEREERELSPADYRRAQSQAYIDWLEEARATATIEDFWSVDKAPRDTLLEQPPLVPTPALP